MLTLTALSRKSFLSKTTSSFHGTSHEPVEGPVLVAFDFDGTLTVKDSFTAFLKWRAGPMGYALGLLRLAPDLTQYLVHRDRGRLKAAAVREFLRGVTRERLEADAKEFAALVAPTLFRDDAMAAWRRWRSRGARPVIVTASPQLIVAPFARGLGADTLIGTELSFDEQDRVVGALHGENCRGAEKVRRLQQVFGADVHLAAAYGDTEGDREMLEIADERGYRVFKGKSV
jgi:phosphatidylglycerophosphatase C